MPADPIERSFELAAERCDDLTPLVYERLFHAHPAMRALFVLDTDDSVKGSMLSWAIRAILELGDGEHGFGRNLIRTEAINHSGNGVGIADFPIFFETLAATMRELLGEDWTDGIDAAWRSLLAELEVALPANAGDID